MPQREVAVLMLMLSAAHLHRRSIVRTPITTGIRSGADVEVLTGLSGGEEVIGVNPAAFREGQEVEIASPAK